MTAQDVEDVIKYFDEEWKKALEDATVAPPGTGQIELVDKGKDKVSSQTKDIAEVPPLTQKRKDAEEVPPGAPKKKKTKASKEPTETALKEDDYELIATILQDAMRDSFQAMQTSQDKLQSTIDQRISKFKALTEKIATMHILPVQATTGEISTPSTSREEVLAKDRINTVLILSGSI